MPVPALPSWNVADEPTAAMLNTRIRDEINALKTLPFAVLRKTSAQGTSSGIHTAVQWNSEDVDTDGGHSNVTNNTRYTAQVAGWYYLIATVLWAGNANGRRDIYFRKNGDATRRYAWSTNTPTSLAAGADIGVTISAHMHLDVGDYVEVVTMQNCGATLNLLASNQDSRFQIQWVATSHGTPMEVPTPKSWTAGLWRAGDMNRHMRDAAQFFMQPPLTIVRKERNSQTIPRFGVMETVSWDTVVHDSAGAFADGTRLYCRRSGYYLVCLQLHWVQDPLTSDTRFHFVKIYDAAGAFVDMAYLFENDSRQTSESYSSSAILSLTEGQYIEAAVQKWPEADMVVGYNPSAEHYGCQFEMRWLST